VLKKVIGILATNKNGLQGYIPCFPSSLTQLKRNKHVCNRMSKTCDYNFVYMNDDIWKPYNETLEFLKEYYDYEEPEDINTANCFNPKYFCRVVEDELVTGFLSNTNQFIPIKVPVPVSEVTDSIKTITSNDTMVADTTILTDTQPDSKRIDFIKRIKLETNFYNVFRNTIRILFNDYINSEKRKKIQEECNKRYVIYKNQLDTVIEMLHDLVDDSIIFATSDDYDYKQVDENNISTCIKNTLEKCNNYVCRITNDKCTLVLPKVNLVNNTDNETYYYGRMADELIRYNRIKSFIFKPQMYLSFGQVKYNLRDNEIIILQDLLNSDFFENLVPAYINKYAKYNTFDTAEPIVSQEYSKEVEINDIINPYHVRNCTKGNPEKITSGIWRNCLPEKCKEILYSGSNFCSLYMVIDIVEKTKGIKVTVEEIKEVLVEQYSKLTNNFTNSDRIDKIIDVLREEAQFDANQLQDKTINFEQMILQEGFVAINFDLWLLLFHYQPPSIFISSKNIPETRYNANEFVCFPNDSGSEYVFILTPAMYHRLGNKLPEYKLIIEDNNININIDTLRNEECIAKINKAIYNSISVEDYLDVIFEKDITTKYKPRQKGLREIDIEIIEEEAPIAENQGDIVEELGEEEIELPVRKPKIKRIRRIKPKIILEEEPGEIEIIEEPEAVVEELGEEEIEIIPVVKKRKTKKQRERMLRVNPPGKKNTRRKLPESVEILDEYEEIIN